MCQPPLYRVIIYSFSAKGNLRRGTSGQMGERMLGTVKLLIIFADYVQCGWGPKVKRPRVTDCKIATRHNFCASFSLFICLPCFNVSATMRSRFFLLGSANPYLRTFLVSSGPVCIVQLVFSPTLVSRT